MKIFSGILKIGAYSFLMMKDLSVYIFEHFSVIFLVHFFLVSFFFKHFFNEISPIIILHPKRVLLSGWSMFHSISIARLALRMNISNIKWPVTTRALWNKMSSVHSSEVGGFPARNTLAKPFIVSRRNSSQELNGCKAPSAGSHWRASGELLVGAFPSPR